MADTPTPAYSVRVRVRMVNAPGMLGKLAIAIGDVGGNISGLRGFEVKTATLDEDARAARYDAAHRLLLADGAVLPILHDIRYTLVKPAVRGLAVTPLGIMALDDVWLEH